MNLPAFCIRRPAFTIVISLVMVIMGVIGYMNLPVRWIPNINPPEITIITAYNGASASLVEHDITKIIEDGLSGVNGVDSLTSTSRQGSSEIYLSFKLGQSMDAAVADIRSSIERVRDTLPKEASNPIVLKTDPNNMPIMYLSFYDNQRSEREMSDYVDKFIVPRLETQDGVGSVYIYGKRVSAMRIWLDPEKMAGANVTASDVITLLQDQSGSIPSGQIRTKDRFYPVFMDTALKNADQFNDLIVRNDHQQVIRLKDIGLAKLDPENVDDAFRVRGKPALAIGIVPQPTANPLDVEKGVVRVFEEMKRSMPDGMHAEIVYNQADYIRASVDSVYESFLEAVLFVWLVILGFLCSFRATLIPLITIPVCLISTFAILYFFGFSINTITLMAFVLAIGLVVDDAIVMLENISRHVEAGMSAFSAALKGSGEMVFPIIAMTLTLAAVYAPIAFTPGLLGVLFREFTFTLAGAVVISGIVALTLSPMMCARILSKNKNTHRYSEWLSYQLSHLQDRYQQFLVWMLYRRRWVLGVLAAIALTGLAVFHSLPAELAPSEDMGEVDVNIAAPRSASFTYGDNYVRQLEAIYDANPDVKSYFSAVGTSSPSHAFQMVQLKPSRDRRHTTEEIVAALTQQADTIAGVRVNISPAMPPLAQVAGDEGDSLGLVIMTTGDYLQLRQVTQKVLEDLRGNPGFTHVDNRLKWDSEQFQVSLDRERASDLKVPVPVITDTISTMLAGRNIGKMDEANIRVQMNETSQANPNIIQQLYVRNESNNVVPLSQLVSVNAVSTPEVFHRYERLRADTIYASLAPNFKLADAVKAMSQVAKQDLPADMKFTFTGEAKSFLESSGKTAATFGLALLFIYLVLVAQFESFIDPLIILLTVPFAMVGAMLTLKLFGGSINIYSNIGLITLIGLIAKHGILITEFANRLRLEGKSVQEAVIQAALLRLRPILMTTAAMVLGALPLAFAFGPGAESRQQVGLVIAGGLLFGTFFSLVVVPVTYTYLSPFRRLRPLNSE